MKISKWATLGLLTGITSISVPLAVLNINKSELSYQSSAMKNLTKSNNVSFEMEQISFTKLEKQFDAYITVESDKGEMAFIFNIRVSANLQSTLDLNIIMRSGLDIETYKDFFEPNISQINNLFLKNINYALEETFNNQSFTLTKFSFDTTSLESGVQANSPVTIDYEIKNKYLEDLNAANKDNESKDNQIKSLNNDISSLNTTQIILIVVIVLLVIAMVVWFALTKRKKAKKI